MARITGACPGLDALLPRPRFPAEALDLEWPVLSIETGERFCFAAHLGRVLDILEWLRGRPRHQGHCADREDPLWIHPRTVAPTPAGCARENVPRFAEIAASHP
jgi:hypothetical protein